jgi:hypothetical protein
MPTTKRFLVKVAETKGLGLTSFKLANANLNMRKLFEAPVAEGAPSAFAASPVAQAGTWFVAEPRDQVDTLAMQEDLGGHSPWDLAHAMREQLERSNAGEVLAVEPDLDQTWVTEDPRKPVSPFAAAPSCDLAEPQETGVLPHVDRFAWHLDKDFSGLKAARDVVGEGVRNVAIAHLDTGYFKGHKLLPEKLDLARQRNFVPGEKPNDAHDPGVSGLLKNPGHGMGTLGILAGGRLNGMVPVPIGNNPRQDINTNEFLGGAPRASVVPMRIANSVVHFSTASVAEAIDEARKLKVDVISMSMGGLPSSAWADAVNAAYEAGIVIVCAAGNNFGGFPTSSIVYPARFRRVIAACGVMANDAPYFNLPPFTMQGCVGPRSKMATAIAAYTPNIPWARWGCAGTIDLDGAGTSSATPQVAATAALWLMKNQTNYSKPWMKVEAVREALFKTAFKPDGGVSDLLGQGILAARKAVDVAPAAEAGLRRQPADSADFSFLKLLTGLGITQDPRLPLYELELSQIALTSKAVREVAPDFDPSGPLPERDSRRILEAILDEGRASRALRKHLELSLGRPTSTVVAPAGPQPPAPVDQAPGVPPGPPPAIDFVGVVTPATTIERRTVRPPPKHRRLQIFATDPGASNRLDTAFINRAVIRVPWEAGVGSANLLQPGPVGEYIEVVDVDPASGRLYEPVDLNDAFLLAEDGHAPSVGNPQFHQQMVYAVAMKTIEHFEQALGRAVLWAPKRPPRRPGEGASGTPTDPLKPGLAVPDRQDDVYVKRLRIYPHALRQANAFYSPDKASLLFGYFPDRRDDDRADDARIVFTCLSHDIVAHETTHAILDGLHRRYQEATNPDVHAFHEALSDIVAVFQHFTFPDVLAHQIQYGRGDLRNGELLVGLAHEFGQAIGYSRALRSAIGDPSRTLATAEESHDRGSILVAAVFDAFLAVYRRRIDDLLRLATGGSGILRPGAIHPDLVARLANEAAKTASDVLTICIRALDYAPPVDINFGDYLRALITADSDLVAEDRYGYRVAFLEAFAARGIYPDGVRSLSVESLRWAGPAWQPAGMGKFLRDMALQWRVGGDREEAYRRAKFAAAALHGWIKDNIGKDVAPHFGLDFTDPNRRFEVHSVRPATRVSRDGTVSNDIVVVITQSRDAPFDPADPSQGTFRFRGGCTLIVDADDDTTPIRYVVIKRVNSVNREQAQRDFLQGHGSLNSLYFGGSERREPFAMIHCGH